MAENDAAGPSGENPDSADQGSANPDRTGAAADETSGAGYGNNADATATPSDPGSAGKSGSGGTDDDAGF